MGKLGLVLVLAIIFGVASYHYFIEDRPNVKFSIASPLPNLLTKTFPNAYGAGEMWRPNEEVVEGSISVPELKSRAAAAYDLTEGKFVYRENDKTRLPIASLTKIMTAIIALENIPLDQKIKIGKQAATIGEDSMGLSEGEVMTLNDLLFGLMLNSGNDAAEAIATSSKFGRDNFVYLMNKKAEELGLTDTHYTNPTGLEGDGNQYSTVDDLLVITRYALANPTFAEAAATYQHDIPFSQTHKAYTLYNETNLLTSYPGVKGVKTGYTDEAGMCLVTYLDYDGHKIIGVLLNAENRREGMKELLDYSLKSLGVKPPPHS